MFISLLCLTVHSVDDIKMIKFLKKVQNKRRFPYRIHCNLTLKEIVLHVSGYVLVTCAHFRSTFRNTFLGWSPVSCWVVNESRCYEFQRGRKFYDTFKINLILWTRKRNSTAKPDWILSRKRPTQTSNLSVKSKFEQLASSWTHRLLAVQCYVLVYHGVNSLCISHCLSHLV
jgi:hypothetical protein